MSFRRNLLAAGFILSSIAAPVVAGEEDKGMYVTGSIGVVSTQDQGWDYTTGGTKYTGDLQFDNGTSYEIGIGYDFGNRFRTDVTWNKNNGSLDAIKVDQAGVAVTGDLDVDVSSFFINGYYDLTEGNKFTPYIGAGIGQSTASSDSGTFAGVAVDSGSESMLGYQFKLGGTYELSDSQDLFVEAGFQGTEDFTSENVNYDGVGMWSLRGGMKISL